MICRGFRDGRSVHGLGGKASEDSQLPLQRAGYILNLEWQSGCLTLWHERKTMEACLYAPRPMLSKPSQRFPGWQPCAQVGSGGTLPLQMPFWRGWTGEYGQGLLLQSSRTPES